MGSVTVLPSLAYKFAMDCIEDQGLDWFKQFESPDDEILVALIKGLLDFQHSNIDPDSVAHYIFGELRDDGSNDFDAWLLFQAEHPGEAARQKREIEEEVRRRAGEDADDE